jgi:histidine triad (HIT) family protein
MSHDPNCIFCKIVEGKIPSRKLYEDEDVLAFHDIAPWAPVHFMLVPKRHIASMAQLAPEDGALMGRIMTLAPKLALEAGARPYPHGGFRVVVNTGDDGGQEVHHLHVHVIGGPRPWQKDILAQGRPARGD